MIHDTAQVTSEHNRPLQRWQLCCLGMCILVLYAPVLFKLVADWWRYPEYSHGFLIPIFAAVVAWGNREFLSSLKPEPNLLGLGLVLCSIGALFIGSLGAELFIARCSFVGVLTGVILYFFGWRVLRVLAFCLAVLLLMIPLPAIIYNNLIFPLQLLASQIAAGCLELIRIVPVLREGNVLNLPGTQLEVVEACSGIRSLISLIALAVIYGYFAETRIWVRSALVLLMVPLAVTANAVRVLITALATQVWGAAATEGWQHQLAGLTVFLFAIAAIVFIHSVIRRVLKHVSSGMNRVVS